MTRRLAVLIILTASSAAAQPAAGVREAITKPVALLQRTGVRWYQKQTCTSCHQQDLPMMVMRLAQERGVPVDQALQREAVAKAYGFLTSIDRAVQNTHLIDPSMDYGMSLLGAHDAGVPRSLTTALYARLLASRQKPDGRWITMDERPPQSHSVFTATAIAMRALQLYMPDRLRADADARVKHAREWLLANVPATTEDRVFQLRGLAWAGTDHATLARLAAPLLSQQHPDGGWAQLPGLESDAYATGEVLVALRETLQTPDTDRAWQNGLRYLQRTQLADGTWRVRSRMHEQRLVSPPYFETGFPHGANQVISTMGTTWATAALLLSMNVSGASAPLPVDRAVVSPAAEPWMDPAIFGTPLDLKALLDRGLDPNSHTPEGTTLLMMTAHDPAKVRLLLAHGANANARAKSGFTAVMIAANYAGASESIRLLAGKGAGTHALNPPPMFNASAAFYAVFSGDTANLDALAPTAADLRHKMNVIGMAPLRPIDVAAAQRDVPMIRYLAAHGVDVNEEDADVPISPLSQAVMENDLPTARALLTLHADPNRVDASGMTPLLHAASVDFGDTDMVALLLASGATPATKTKAQQTPQQLAQLYGHAAIARLLTPPR